MKWRFDGLFGRIITLFGRWSAVALAAAHAPQSAPSAVPIVNSVRFEAFNCPPLTPRQVDSLVQTARERLPGIAAELWFVYARRNDIWADGDAAVATVFMKPDERVGRVSKGWMAHVDTSIDDSAVAAILAQLEQRSGPASQPTSALVDKNQNLPSHPAAAFRGVRYVYVAPNAGPTAGDVPSSADMPFGHPADFGDVELVEIVDFVRALRGAGPGFVTSAPAADSSTVVRLDGVDPTFPILRIVRAADRIEVWTGTIEGIVSGHGQRLDLTRDAAGKLVLRQVSIWYS